jgi:membrane-bound lytic murein transglycosylase MltF
MKHEGSEETVGYARSSEGVRYFERARRWLCSKCPVIRQRQMLTFTSDVYT